MPDGPSAATDTAYPSDSSVRRRPNARSALSSTRRMRAPVGGVLMRRLPYGCDKLSCASRSVTSEAPRRHGGVLHAERHVRFHPVSVMRLQLRPLALATLAAVIIAPAARAQQQQRRGDPDMAARGVGDT